ncbi:MAG: hypothetical protein JWP11_1791 [Frankiales bacterium]|jgi:hypothetical protein|nr:hypothetical protein [Frankiales bacterium]
MTRLWRLIRSAPVTTAYVGVVAAIAIGSRVVGDAFADRLARDSSTDLDNLRTVPAVVLPASAFVLDHPSQLAWLPLLALAMGAVERWRGSLAAALTFVAGHVGATLLVAGWLSAGISLGWVHPSGHVIDVGVSYGEAALWGLLAARVPRRWRGLYLGGQAAGLLAFLAVRHGFTDIGHLAGWTIGLLLAAVLVRRARDGRAGRPARPATPTPAR